MVIEKKIWFKSLCYIQSIFILLTTVGLSLNFHYCQGSIKSIGVYAPAKKCEGEAQISTCNNHSKPNFKRKACCSDKQFFYQNNSFNQPEEFIKSQSTSIELITYYEMLDEVPFHSSDEFFCHSGFDPPTEVKDLNILYDTFLI